MKKIYFLRHCEAERHPTLLYTLDSLTKRGEQQAANISMNFSSRVDCILSSPYMRAKKTAKIIGEKINIGIEIDSNWGELNRGFYTERPYQEFLEEWEKQGKDYDYAPPSGESVNHVRKRIVSGIDNVILVVRKLLQTLVCRGITTSFFYFS
ncbi:MAG: phosphoglycerate mutase family protein [Nanoarchaeota archaeon]|nr:phosphoglycerate mutase family protein [Nanoarchaeota archaeon]